jgi:hypothetical protein
MAVGCCWFLLLLLLLVLFPLACYALRCQVSHAVDCDHGVGT